MYRSGGTSRVYAFPAHLQFNVATSGCDDPRRRTLPTWQPTWGSSPQTPARKPGP
jgi:hypothetical protein